MRTRWLVVAIVALVALLSPAREDLLHAQTPASVQTAEPRVIEIHITDDGYDGIPEGWTLNLQEGEYVELKFLWEQVAFTTDAHLFVLEGYNVESEEINYYNRESSIRFVADKPGTFRLKCDLDCEIHDLLKAGTVIVGRGGSGGAAAAVTGPPTTMTMAAPAAALAGDSVGVRISVFDESGAPVTGGSVELYEVTGFMGTQEQEVAVSSGSVGADGVAELEYRAHRDGVRKLNAYYKGTVDFGPSDGSVELQVNPSTQLYVVDRPVGIPGVNRFLVVTLLGGIWGTMLIVAVIVTLIAREGARAAEVGDG